MPAYAIRLRIFLEPPGRRQFLSTLAFYQKTVSCRWIVALEDELFPAHLITYLVLRNDRIANFRLVQHSDINAKRVNNLAQIIILPDPNGLS